MKTDVTYVDATEFEAIILGSGLKHLVQKGFVKVLGPAGRNVYVASTKRVGRVDLSGFEMRDAEGGHLPGYRVPHVGPFGNVKQQLDFSRPQEEILQTFRLLLEHLKTLGPVEKRRRKEASPRKDAPAGWTKIDPRARLALIRARAAQKGEGPAPVAEG